MSFQFDELQQAPCEVETPVACDTETPGVDPRCADPAFAILNPDICPASVKLIVKPNKNLICQSSAAQFRAYLVSDLGEQLLTVGVTFTSNNPTVLVVGSLSGNATGIAAGIATIQAEWQGLHAFSQITVLDSASCCDGRSVGMLLVIDNSKSMKLLFEGYGSKLDFAKFAAQAFAGDLNTTKDKLGVEEFSEAGSVILGLSQDVAAINTAIIGILPTNESTNIFDGLEEAINYLKTQTVDERVIILLTDGENKQGPDPVQLANDFIDSGGVIEVVGVRAYGDGFALLQIGRASCRERV